MRLLRNKKGQGTTEYIAIVAIAVGIAIALIWNLFQGQLSTALTGIGQQINKIVV